MPSRYDAALRLDISLEMAKRHNLPAMMSQAELDDLDQNPPPWLEQSRANRTGRRPVWATLQCVLCNYTEHERPKKWWPEFTMLFCNDHVASALPGPIGSEVAKVRREFVYGVGANFTGVVDRLD